MCNTAWVKCTLFAYTFLNSNGDWLSTAEVDVDPIFDLANKYELAIQIHPYDGEKMLH